MEFYLAAVINGILMGSVYGLTAVGLTLIFGVMKVINFAHGSFLMVSMFASYYLFALTGMDPYVGLIFVIPFCFGFGYFSQKFLIQPMFKMERGVREPMGVLLVTTGLMMVLDNLALLLFGADFKSAQTSYWGQSYRMGEIMISAPRLFAFFGMLIGSGALFFYLKKTTMGRAIRATGQDRDAAGLMGIDVYQIYNVAFALGIAITGLAGVSARPLLLCSALGWVLLHHTGLRNRDSRRAGVYSGGPPGGAYRGAYRVRGGPVHPGDLDGRIHLHHFYPGPLLQAGRDSGSEGRMVKEAYR